MTRRAVSFRVIPNMGFSSQDGSKKRFCTLGVFNLEFLEICKFVLQTRIFYRFLGSRLSIGGVKSQNEFVTKALRWNKHRFHGTEKSKFLGAKIDVFHDTENSKF